MQIIITARNKEQENTDYLMLKEQGLSETIEMSSGNGSPKNPFQSKVCIHNENETTWSGVIHIELPFDKINPRYFLPAFMYGRNRGECPQNVPNEFPRLREELNRPSSPSWMVRSDRLSHPVALVYDTGKIYGLCASPYFIINHGLKQQWKPEMEGEFYQYAGYTCSLSKGTVGYTLGYENAPWLFIQSHDVRNRSPLSDNCFELEAGETVEFTLDLYEFEAKTELDINAVIEEVYYRYHQSPRKASDIKTTVTDLAQAVYQDAWLPEDLSYSGQVFEDKKNGVYRYNKIISISWTNGLSVATPMLMAALRLGNESMRQQALSCITNIIEHSLNPSTGMPFEAYSDEKWSIHGWWFDGMHTPGHSSYLIGQSLFYILKAYDYEMRFKNYHHEDWLAFVKAILMKIEKTKNTDDEYPYVFSEKTGAGVEYDAFSGTWCMAALAYYCYLTGDKTHMYSLKQSEKHYYETYIKHMECYGGPLDTDKATDSEGILAYIKAIRFLHALTGEEYCLKHMKDAISYEFSFKFSYNSPIKLPPLSRIGWSSCGGSVTSIANPHIHPMSSNIVDELLYFVENSEDKYVKDRMMDTIGWGCQTYNRYDKEYDYGKKGWMSERFCYSQGLVSEKYSDGSLASTWFCLMPWASGSIIDGLAGDYWDKYWESNVVLVTAGKAATIYVDSKGKDYEGLNLVVKSFSKDINMVTGITPEISMDIKKLNGIVVIVGSIGNNDLIDFLSAEGIINVSAIKNKRECYKIEVVENPVSGVDKAIIIVGSDKRGTIYGIYHISELIGISPWVYFGDVVPIRQSELIFSENKLNITSKEPSVKYRGFFLNDEWPSLGSWVTGKFGDFNEEFYDKVFQLILRLKGNFLWPAMWSAVFSENGKSSSIANAKLANAYGIVMGTSHHEPMFRAGEEWKKINHQYGTNKAWDFSTNAEVITKFWEDGLLRNKDFESLITLGMRGEQDSALIGSEKENIELLKSIIKTQKRLLKKHGLDDAPQVLTIYKEVEKYWYGTDKADGLRNWDVLDDVTIMLADDNFGNLRTLPTEKERNRKGGFGMYYHFDYHGGPRSYEWVNSTPIEKVWEQMSMAYDYGIRDIWIVNVGDLKPMEQPISYFLDLAYDFDTWGTNGINKTAEYTKQWVKQQFKKVVEQDIIDGIATVLSDYTRMNGKRKPEITFDSTYSYINYNEAQRVLTKAINIEKNSLKYHICMPEAYKDAYYQLVHYPAVASANVVKMQIFAGLNKLYYDRESILANYYAELVKQCKETDNNMQSYYNNSMSAGKWNGMMSSPHIGYIKWSPDGSTYPQVNYITSKDYPYMIVDVEGIEKECLSAKSSFPVFTNLGKENYTITISNGGSKWFDYKVETSADWIKVDNIQGSIDSAKIINVSVDWTKVSKASIGVITIFGAGETVKVNVTAEVIDTHGLANMTFAETHEVISIEAEHTSNNVAKSNAKWKVIENYGRSLSSLKMFPTTVSFEKPEDAPYLEYIINLNEDLEYMLTIYVAPTNNLYANSRLRYGVSFDGETPITADALPKKFVAGTNGNKAWEKAVMENIHTTTTSHKLRKGTHTLHFYGLDAGLILQKLVLSKGKLPNSYFGPEESFYVGKN